MEELVDVLGVELADELHHQGTTLFPARRQKQVDVVGHQAVRMHRAIVLPCEEGKVPEVRRVIVVAEEALVAVVAALPHVQGHIWNDDAGGSWHGISTSLAEAG